MAPLACLLSLLEDGIECTFISPDATDEEINATFRPNTKCVFGETVYRPALVVLDIERWAKAAHDHGGTSDC